MTINKNGEGGIKTLKVQFIDGKPSKPEEIQPVKKLKKTDFIQCSCTGYYSWSFSIVNCTKCKNVPLIMC